MSISLLQHRRNFPDKVLDVYNSKSKLNHITLNEVELANFRTMLCESHQKGQCKNADSCPHSHCLTWQRRNPYAMNYSAKLCPEIEFVRKKDKKMNLVRHCNRGRTCTHAHSKEEELYHPLMYKTKMCSAFPNCHRFYCPFAHSKEEIRRPQIMEHIKSVWNCLHSTPLKTPCQKQSNSINSNGTYIAPETKTHAFVHSDVLGHPRKDSFASNSTESSNPSQVQSLNSQSLQTNQDSNHLISKGENMFIGSFQSSLKKEKSEFSSFVDSNSANSSLKESILMNYFLNSYQAEPSDSRESFIQNKSETEKSSYNNGLFNFDEKANFTTIPIEHIVESNSIPFQKSFDLCKPYPKKTSDSDFSENTNCSNEHFTGNFSFDPYDLESQNNCGTDKFNEDKIACLLIEYIKIMTVRDCTIPVYIKVLAEWIIYLLENYRNGQTTQQNIDFVSVVQICVEFLKLLTPKSNSEPDYNYSNTSYIEDSEIILGNQSEIFREPKVAETAFCNDFNSSYSSFTNDYIENKIKTKDSFSESKINSYSEKSYNYPDCNIFPDFTSNKYKNKIIDEKNYELDKKYCYNPKPSHYRELHNLDANKPSLENSHTVDLYHPLSDFLNYEKTLAYSEINNSYLGTTYSSFSGLETIDPSELTLYYKEKDLELIDNTASPDMYSQKKLSTYSNCTTLEQLNNSIFSHPSISTNEIYNLSDTNATISLDPYISKEDYLSLIELVFASNSNTKKNSSLSSSGSETNSLEIENNKD